MSAQNTLFLPYDATSLTDEQKSSLPERLAYPTDLKNTVGSEVEFVCTQQSDVPHPFSVSHNRQVLFSPGNLQYNAALGTHRCADGSVKPGTWRFAEHQWDYVGDAKNGTVYYNGTKCDNTQVSESYDGWIDLFGWGTSGWESGAAAYQPWAVSTTGTDYQPGGDPGNHLTEDYAYADWAVYNQIGDDPAGTWRTLTTAEWTYVFEQRPGYAFLRGQATVCGVHGYMLLPDDWVAPVGITFTGGIDIGYDVNVYSPEQWEAMEAEGAVFLSASGSRSGTAFGDAAAGNRGAYWSVSGSGNTYAYRMWFRGEGAEVIAADRNYGRPVRPVKDLSPVSPQTDYQPMPFSVAADRQVCFSPGNLQYNAARGSHRCADGSVQPGTWRFAERQWDYVGDAQNGTVYHNETKCSNTDIGETYNGWIDLFGWGTSGWNSGAIEYQPWAISQTSSDYMPGGNANNNLTDDYAYSDWGMYNAVGDDPAGTWRTLTKEEWTYLFRERENADKLFGLGTVNGVKGTIILPDGWVTPLGVTFNASTDKGLSWQETNYANSAEDNYSHNTFTARQWEEQMAANGAVFLPSAGYRYGTTMTKTGEYGSYWSASACETEYISDFNFSELRLCPQYKARRFGGRSVRPVKDVAPPPPPSAYEPKPFSISAGRQVLFSPGNLQYNAALGTHKCADGTTQQGTWRFAEHQWDFVGDAQNGNVYFKGIKCDNALISDTYDGWIDFFGWGTSGWNSGAKEYQPWATGKANDDYITTGYEESDLTGSLAWADWGMYNEINGDTPGTWRSLTKEESYYLLVGRANANQLFGFGTVNNIIGLILLPDEWNAPSEVTFASGSDKGMEWDGNSGLYNSSNDHFADNVYTGVQWQKMENAGAVFLPAAGYRRETTGYSVRESGNYWLASYGIHESAHGACYMNFPSNRLYPERHHYRYNGGSVRLVKDQTPPPPSAYIPQPFSVSADRQILFSSGNLQYNAALGTHQCADGTTQQGIWRFAEHQWDIAGMGYGQTDKDNHCYIGGTVQNGDNRNISETCDGWTDLFGWGTSGWNSGAKNYRPWNEGKTNSNYLIGGKVENDMRGKYSYADWGVYNDIVNGSGTDRAGTWHTMTESDWAYIVLHRPNATGLFALATVNGVKGMILLPDNWNPEDKPHLITSTEQGFYVANDTIYNDQRGSFETNILSAWQWLPFEAEGAVFLPCAGHRHEKTLKNVNEWGDYSPSTNMAKRYRKSKYELPVFFFSAVSCKPGCPSDVRYCGKSVRLVSDCPPSSSLPPYRTATTAAAEYRTPDTDYWTPYTDYRPEEPDPWISTGHRTATAELWAAEPERSTPKPERKTPKEDDPEEDTYVEEPADTVCWQSSYRFHDYDYPLPSVTVCRDRDYVAYTLEYFDKDACTHYLKDIAIATTEGGTVELYDTICDGTTYDFFGEQLTHTDVYTRTIPIARDCEQVYILHLTVHPSYSGIEQTEHICPSGSFVWNGAEYTDEGDYTLSLSSANGCDSLVTLHLRHYPYYERQLTDTLLTGQTILFEGTELASAGTYSVTLPSVDGCDSVITLMLEENAVQVLSATCNDLCSDKEELHISLDFTGTAHSVRLTFDSAAHVAGWRDTLIVLTDDGDIVLPARGRVGQFTCTAELLFRDTQAASVTIPFTLPYPSTVLKQLWDDGVAVMNADYNGGYDFVAFQWYENGVPLAGETASILYRPLIMGGEYSALLTESNGRQMLCCPLIATSRTALETPDIGITIYPTLASPSETIRCHAEQPAELTVYDIHGRTVDHFTVPAGTGVFSAPVVPGLYMVLMQPLHSGRAATVKLMVIPNGKTATKQ